jgi:hypothetical protein
MAMAPTPPPKQQAGGTSSMLTRQVGPLPAWGWLVVAVVGFVLWRKLKGGSTGTTGTTGATGVTGAPTAAETFPGGYSYNGPASGAAFYQQALSPGVGGPGNPPGPVVSPGNTGTALSH